MRRTGNTWQAMLIGGSMLLVVGLEPAAAEEKPSPFELGEYIGWLVSCNAIPGSHEQVGQALRRAVERLNPWDYSEDEIDTLIKSLRFGKVGRDGWDNGEQICAQLTSDKEGVEAVKFIIEFGR